MVFKVEKPRDGVFEIYEDGELVARYLYGEHLFKPYFYPVNAPGGLCVTEDEPRDHVHHRSMWTAHGDVNGEDFWTETPRSGRQTVKNVSVETLDEVCRVRSDEVWRADDGRPVVDVYREVVFWRRDGGFRFIDVDVVFKASYGVVRFGDTKEGGILSFRVSPSMRGDKGGVIRNSLGGLGEPECWGKRAEWCDYTGPLEGGKAGITVFDHPENFRHPTYWHVRAYGLFAANPFGISYFERDKSLDGSLTIDKGETLRFRYRALIHLDEVEPKLLDKLFEEYVEGREPV